MALRWACRYGAPDGEEERRTRRPDSFAADFLRQADWKSLDGDSMTPARWEEPSLDGFSVTVPVEISIRVDRRGPSAEIKTAPSKRQEM